MIKFSSGDRMGADIRLINANNLEIEESALTGESDSNCKSIDPIHGESPNLGDLSNMAFMGTLVTRGNGIGVVTGTGMKQQWGKLQT